MLAPNRIRFGGVFSNELNMPDLIMDCAFESDDSEVSTFLTREAVASESYDGRTRRISSFKYTENFAPKFTFLKKGFGDFTQEEIRILLKYLTYTDTTGLLEAYDNDSNVISWASIGNFSEIQLYKIANKRVVGVTAVWDSISPFCFSDLYTITQNVATEIKTTMYYWTALADGASTPQYLLTYVKTPVVGTTVYSVPSAVSGTVISTAITLYGTILAVNEDGSYVIDDTIFTLTLQGTKYKRTYNNQIVINIDTDDNQPVYPRITINHGYNGAPHTIIPVPPGTVYSATSDLVENTVYFNGTTYYWKTAGKVSGTTKPSYDWDVIEIDHAYTSSDTWEVNTIYYYPTNQTYYWIDPYYFHSATSSNNPNLTTTSVKITNQHYDAFNQASTPASMIVKNNSSTEQIIIDGANRIISSSSTRRIFGDDFSWDWLPLYDGKNVLTVEGNCEVTLEYRETRKIGSY